jgi:hypothetical protein
MQQVQSNESDSISALFHSTEEFEVEDDSVIEGIIIHELDKIIVENEDKLINKTLVDVIKILLSIAESFPDNNFKGNLLYLLNGLQYFYLTLSQIEPGFNKMTFNEQIDHIVSKTDEQSIILLLLMIKNILVIHELNNDEKSDVSESESSVPIESSKDASPYSKQHKRKIKKSQKKPSPLKMALYAMVQLGLTPAQMVQQKPTFFNGVKSNIPSKTKQGQLVLKMSDPNTKQGQLVLKMSDPNSKRFQFVGDIPSEANAKAHADSQRAQARAQAAEWVEGMSQREESEGNAKAHADRQRAERLSQAVELAQIKEKLLSLSHDQLNNLIKKGESEIKSGQNYRLELGQIMPDGPYRGDNPLTDWAVELFYEQVLGKKWVSPQTRLQEVVKEEQDMLVQKQNKVHSKIQEINTIIENIKSAETSDEETSLKIALDEAQDDLSNEIVNLDNFVKRLGYRQVLVAPNVEYLRQRLNESNQTAEQINNTFQKEYRDAALKKQGREALQGVLSVAAAVASAQMEKQAQKQTQKHAQESNVFNFGANNTLNTEPYRQRAPPGHSSYNQNNLAKNVRKGDKLIKYDPQKEAQISDQPPLTRYQKEQKAIQNAKTRGQKLAIQKKSGGTRKRYLNYNKKRHTYKR